MDKINFGRLVNILTQWGMRELDHNEMTSLSRLVSPVAENGNSYVSEANVNLLMHLMQEKVYKIDAIKAYRTLTNAGLREAKDAVEKYW